MTAIEAPRVPPSPRELVLAWAVHLFTASGAVIAALALLAIASGAFARAGILMLVALSIDSVDGTLARRVGVGRIVPQINGRRLDDIVDYLNYVLVPAVFMVACGSLPHPAWAALPLLASAYGFSQEAAKTDDGFFVGFPSYWNVMALYLWLLDISPSVSVAIVTGFSILVFVPLKYIYPSHLRVLRGPTAIGGFVFVLVLAWGIVDPDPARGHRFVQLSLVYVAWYFGLSFWLGGIHRSSA